MKPKEELTLAFWQNPGLRFNFFYIIFNSIIECGSFCVITPGCLAFLFNKENKTCKLGNGTGLIIQANQSFVEGTIKVQVKEGLVMTTNGNKIMLASYKCDHFGTDLLNQTGIGYDSKW
jgi:hypothetical protein